MRTVTAEIKGRSTYSQGRQFAVELKNGETHDSHEARTWRNRMHTMPDGRVFIPPMAFKLALSDAASYCEMKLKGHRGGLKKHFEGGLYIDKPIVLDVLAENVHGEWRSVPADGKKKGGKTGRVLRCFPEIPQWGGTLEIHVLDELLLNFVDSKYMAGAPTPQTVLEYHLRRAGEFIGIGVFRPASGGYFGRFSVEAFTVPEKE